MKNYYLLYIEIFTVNHYIRYIDSFCWRGSIGEIINKTDWSLNKPLDIFFLLEVVMNGRI